MKTIKITSLVLVLLAFLGLNSCSDKSLIEYKTTEMSEIFLSLDDIRNGYKAEAPKAIIEAGNIYVYGKYLFINDKYDGLHVVDNSNPSAPNFIAYLRIPGNSDVVIRNNYMYANSGPDLLILDITNPTQVQLVKRVVNALFENEKSNEGNYLIGYGEKEIIEKYYINRGWDFQFGIQEDVQVSSSDNGLNRDGVGGSMARFTLADNYLYFVNNSNLIPIDLSNQINPSIKTSVALGQGTIETIYKYKEYLFVGSMNGVFILDYKTNPSLPTIVSSVQHIRSCDPVVVQNDIAFSTLSNFSRCGGGINELMVLDVTTAEKPKILAEYFMQTTPLGLGVIGNNLFVCQGKNGFTWYKTDKLTEILNNKVSEDVNIHARDIIVIENNLIVTGDNGVIQYTYDTSNGSMTRVSTLFSK